MKKLLKTFTIWFSKSLIYIIPILLLNGGIIYWGFYDDTVMKIIRIELYVIAGIIYSISLLALLVIIFGYIRIILNFINRMIIASKIPKKIKEDTEN